MSTGSRLAEAPAAAALPVRTGPGARACPPAAVVVLGGCVALAALSLLLPSTPTYDPWAWIVWGREIAHLDLSTADGPSWKPLPVIFTTGFSVFGGAAPWLWLVVARAGALSGLVAAFRLARRLGGGVPGGVAAVAALAIAPWYLRNGALGNTEGLLVACALCAVERHLAGERRWAFVLAVLAALLRPEAWPFLGLYGAWLVRADRTAWRLVLGGFLLVPALWIGPELWGSGEALRAAHRAKEASPVAGGGPGAVLSGTWAMLTVPVWVGALGTLVGACMRRIRPPLALAGLAVAWLAIVTVMAGDGYSGNQRYVILPVAIACVVAGAGAGWLVRAVAARSSAGCQRGASTALLAAGAVVLAALFGLAGGSRTSAVLDQLGYEARLVNSLDDAIAAAGGKAAVQRCGKTYTGPFLIPALAWQLHVHTSTIGFEPVAPATILRERTTNTSPSAVPALDGVGGEAGVRTLAATPRWRIVTTCVAQ